MTISKLWVSSLALLATVSLPLQAASPVTVGSKIDTEGALLGNMILQVLESHGVKTVNKIQLDHASRSWRDYRRRAGYLSGIHR